MRLPEWHETSSAYDNHKVGGPKLTALENFIYDFEPANREEAADFRAQLAKLITENCGCKCKPEHDVKIIDCSTQMEFELPTSNLTLDGN